MNLQGEYKMWVNEQYIGKAKDVTIEFTDDRMKELKVPFLINNGHQSDTDHSLSLEVGKEIKGEFKKVEVNRLILLQLLVKQGGSTFIRMDGGYLCLTCGKMRNSLRSHQRHFNSHV
jgi:hypothetical protein